MMKNLNLKKVVGVLGVVILVLGITIFCVIKKGKLIQEQELPEQAKGEGPKLIWQKKFEEKIEKVAGEKGKPSVLISKNKVIFINGKGNILRKYQITKIPKLAKFGKARVSKNGKYIGIFEPLDYNFGKHYVTKAKFRVIDDKGKVLWEKNDLFIEGDLEILNDGYVIVTDQFLNNLYFYDLTGNLVKEVKIFKNRLSEQYVSVFTAVSRDANYYVVNTQEKENIPKSYVILYEKSGDEIWRRTLDKDIRSLEVGISRNGEYILAIGNDKKDTYFYMFNHNGKLLWRYGIAPLANYKISFSPKAKYIAIGSNYKELYLFETKTGKLVWKYTDRNIPIRGFISIDIASDGAYLVGGITEDNSEYRYVYLFNKQGARIWEKKCSGKYHHWEDGPRVNITPDGKEIRIIEETNISFYQNISN